MRRALMVLGVAAALAGSACTKSKLAEGEATPTTPPSLSGASSLVPSTTATTVAKVLPEVCKNSDEWGLAIIKATDPTQAAGQTAAQLTANLDAFAATLKGKLPEFTAQIDTRTDVAKKKLAGAVAEADEAADKTAAEELNVWYVATCS